MSKKTPVEIVDYVEKGLHTTNVTQSITSEFVAITGKKLLKRLPEKLSLAILGCAMFPPFRWIMRFFGPKRDLFCIILKGPTWLVYNSSYFVLGRGKRSAWITDTWPNRDKRMALLANVMNINPIFVTYKQSAERLSNLYPKRDWIYIAEALPKDNYPAKPYHEREWDIVTFGRKYAEHHWALKAANVDGAIKYLFRDDGTLVSDTHEGLLSALANSKVSVCVPRDPVTHHSGGVKAMTMRYLQSMACKCLVIGETPPDMLELFGYDPVIKADIVDPLGQMQEILLNWDHYIPLIEKNFKTLMDHHQWNHRVKAMTSILRDKYDFDFDS